MTFDGRAREIAAAWERGGSVTTRVGSLVPWEFEAGYRAALAGREGISTEADVRSMASFLADVANGEGDRYRERARELLSLLPPSRFASLVADGCRAWTGMAVRRGRFLEPASTRPPFCVVV